MSPKPKTPSVPQARPCQERPLANLLCPRSVAVIGASRRRGQLGGEIFHNMLSNGFTGAVYPVHPKAASVQGVRAYASIREVPDAVDLAVIVVPKGAVAGVVDECVSAGVKGIVVISAGFAEVGEAGRILQGEVLARVRSAGMRMIGPNCLGVINTNPAVGLNATFAPAWPPPGNVAFCSQSGAVGVAILDFAKQLGIGISQFVSIGNKADVSGNDLLEHWEDDPGTRVILLYLESFGNPRKFVEIARRVSRKKPILIVKSGRTAAGARAASSHTGALAGLDVAADALLGQAGVIRVGTIQELFDAAILLSNQPPAAGNRVAILTNAGGPGIMAADACESNGLVLPQLSPGTEAALREFLPKEASTRNPVDMVAGATPEFYEKALGLLLRDENIDSVISLFVPPLITAPLEVAQAVRRGVVGTKKPVLTCFMGSHGVPQALDALREGRIPSYTFPESAAMALARAVRYGKWLARPEARVPALENISAERAREAFRRGPSSEGKGRWLRPDEVRGVLDAYGLRSPRTLFASSEQGAVEAAREIGFPVALKLVSDTITHKSDVGGVVLGLEHADSVGDAFRAIASRLAVLGKRDEMDGVMIQEMAGGGLEAFVGVTQDPLYGPLIGFGIGGVHVEVWKDVVFRVHPLTDLDAREMLEQIRGARLLDGYRGSPAADREALADALLRVSCMVGELPEIRELDINPLMAMPPGRGVIAVDARIRVCR
ncbi:MAG: acetate--CoA ligase family protein [Candidatus Wallbacteria bacterium]|nr:acetate--CoA ligase family protein [Candidatus Wallbacteria bacterium]